MRSHQGNGSCHPRRERSGDAGVKFTKGGPPAARHSSRAATAPLSFAACDGASDHTVETPVALAPGQVTPPWRHTSLFSKAMSVLTSW